MKEVKNQEDCTVTKPNRFPLFLIVIGIIGVSVLQLTTGEFTPDAGNIKLYIGLDILFVGVAVIGLLWKLKDMKKESKIEVEVED